MKTEFRKVHNIMANNTRSVLVVGLGRFGSSVATTLDMMGQDVLAVDKDGELVNRWSSQIPTVQADMTDVMALEQINASDFDTAVVAIGDSVEASVITAGNLLDAGISDIWAKSVSKEHARILQRIGARHIINAETDAANASDILCPATISTTSNLKAHTTSSKYIPPHTWSATQSKTLACMNVSASPWSVSNPRARNSNTVRKSSSCTATTSSSSWASRIRSTGSYAADMLVPYGKIRNFMIMISGFSFTYLICLAYTVDTVFSISHCFTA